MRPLRRLTVVAVAALGLFAAPRPARAQRPPYQVGTSYRILAGNIFGTFRVTGPVDANGMVPVTVVQEMVGLDQIIGPGPLWINTRQVVLVQEARGAEAGVSSSAGAAAATSPGMATAASAAVRSDLRNLVTAQEVFFADNVTYTSDIRRLRFTASTGVTVTITSASGTGWAATAVHARMPGQTCGIFVGSATAPIPGQNEGEPRCAAR